jgi:hypothetical protein
MTKKETEEVKKLSILWEQFCKAEFDDWNNQNPIPVFVNNPRWTYEHAEERKKQWDEYIRKIGDRWWGTRGFYLVWPESNEKPLVVKKIGET